MEPGLHNGYFSAAIVIAITYALTIYVAKLVSTSWTRATFLYIWHTIFTILYAFYTLGTAADATMYFKEGGACTTGLSPGTDFVIVVSCILQSVFGQYYLPVALVSGAIGGVGLVLFDAALRMAAQGGSPNTRFVAKFLPLLPSVSFWSAGLGKDSFAFLAAALFCLAMFNVRHRLLLAFLSIIIMGAVRPHIAALQFAALFMTFIFAGQISFLKRSTLVLIAAAVAFSVLPYVLDYVGLRGGLSLARLNEFVEERQGYNLEGGGGIDISSQHSVERIFTLLFRPTILDARNAQFLMSGLENAILLLLFVTTIFRIFRRRDKNAVPYWITGASYSFLGIVVLSQTIANLGIASRQKWMVILPLMVIAIAIRAARSPVKRREHFAVKPA